MKYRNSRVDRHRFIGENVSEGDPPYFEQRFLKLGPEETFLDIGIGNGGTIHDFIRKVNNRFHRIYGLEICPGYVESAKKHFVTVELRSSPMGHGIWIRRCT